MKLKYLFFLFLIALAGCRKDERIDRQVVVEPSGNTTIEVTSGVTGLVMDEANNPVSNAVVRVYNKQVTTDENGIFYINNQGLRKTSSVVHVQKSGYFDGFKTFLPEVGQKAYVQFQLISKKNGLTVSSEEGGVVDIDGGGSLTLPPNGVVLKDGGDQYNGSFVVHTHWYNPSSLDLGLTMPGNLLGITSEGEEVQLGTYGMIAVEMETLNGIALQLAEEVKATLKFPVPGNLNPPNSIALWSFDEWDAVWQQEGVAKLENGFYVAEVRHFSFWNCDAPFPVVQLEGRIIENGLPVTNFPVSISMSNLVSGYGFTNNEGIFRGKVPKGEDLLLELNHCGEMIYEKALGMFSEDVILGDIEIDLNDFVVNIEGKMVDCNMNPLQIAYGLLKSGEQIVQVITPIANGTDDDGTFSSIVIGCQNADYTVQFFDPENIRKTEIIDILIDEETINFGNVVICDELEEFIELRRENETVLFKEMDVYFSNQEKLIVRSNAPESNTSFSLDLKAQQEGDYNPTSMTIGPINSTGIDKVTICGDAFNNFYPCNQLVVKINKYNTYIEGTFSGFLAEIEDSLFLDFPDVTDFFVEGSFRLKVDHSITTGEISGKTWVDKNNNNIRDDGENDSGPLMKATIHKQEEYQFPINPESVTLYDGSYKFTNLLPGNYIIRMFGTQEYFSVEKNVGSDDKDNDFDFTGSVFETDIITVNTDEIFENVDLGFGQQGTLVCGPISFLGCSPNITVTSTVEGGVPPYQASINGGNFEDVENGIIFTIPEGGDVWIEVIDELGSSCTSLGNVSSFNNKIQGFVWSDLNGGVPNVRDDNEPGLHGIVILLFDDNNILVAEQNTNEGNYAFEDLEPGIYYVQIELSSGFEMVDQNVDIDNGSDIDPVLRRSQNIIIEECNDIVVVDAGLKSI